MTALNKHSYIPVTTSYKLQAIYLTVVSLEFYSDERQNEEKLPDWTHQSNSSEFLRCLLYFACFFTACMHIVSPAPKKYSVVHF